MSDTTYFLIMVTVLVCVVIALIYRALTRHRRSKNWGNDNNVKQQPTTHHTHDRNDDDIHLCPGHSSLKSNIFHKDRYDE